MNDLPESPTVEQIETMRAMIEEHDRIAAADRLAATNALFAPLADILKCPSFATMATAVNAALAALPVSATQAIMALTNVKSALENLDVTVRANSAGLLIPDEEPQE